MDWCVKHCTGVIVQLQDEVIAEIRIVYPDFTIDALFELNRINKLNKFEFEGSDDWLYDRCRNRGHSIYEDFQTYERYFDRWAQDIEGYSDDDIDTIFDGDPDAYWNID